MKLVQLVAWTDESKKLPSTRDLQVQTTVYLLDREAITTDLIKAIWLNEQAETWGIVASSYLTHNALKLA